MFKNGAMYEEYLNERVCLDLCAFHFRFKIMERAIRYTHVISIIYNNISPLNTIFFFVFFGLKHFVKDFLIFI